jgi:hypothetical protein
MTMNDMLLNQIPKKQSPEENLQGFVFYASSIA